MKIRIVREIYYQREGKPIPTFQIHEFEGKDCCLISKTVKGGVITIGIKSSPLAEVYKEWLHIRTIYKDAPHPVNPNEREEIIIYVVEA